MKILITGAKGFIGKNLVVELNNRGYLETMEYDLDDDLTILDRYCQQADFVYHLAGVNRPNDVSEFMEGNLKFTSELLNLLKKHNNRCPVMISSSIQAEMNNPYGVSKKAGEDLLFNYSAETGAKVFVYRFPNVFGKWARPNYNSAVATFCYNIARDLPIQVNDPNVVVNLTYIDDVVHELLGTLGGYEHRKDLFCAVPEVYTVELKKIVELIHSFKDSRMNRLIPDMKDEFARKLYSTYLSYLPEDRFCYELTMHEDHRGSFTEFLRTPERGQVSVNISKPGIMKGNHWHHSKNEKFLVVCGKGVIRFRHIHSDRILEYFVSEDKLEVVDIPPGYTHNIENIGDRDMVTIMWANELFDPENPDTYYLEV